MKRIKKTSVLTKSRDWIRVLFTVSFYGLVLIPHVMGNEGYEIETEYVVLGSILLLGPWFCGWACPFGNLSYFIARLGEKLFSKCQYQFPNKVHKALSYLKYVLLLYFVGIMIVEGVNYFGDHMRMYGTNSFTQIYIKFKHVAVVLVPLFLPRFFCKYLCFQKAAYNIINKVFPFTVISRDTDKCVQCKKCDKSCPMDIQISQIENVDSVDYTGDTLTLSYIGDKEKRAKLLTKLQEIGLEIISFKTSNEIESLYMDNISESVR